MKVIAISGIDGSGKSTLVHRLRTLLSDEFVVRSVHVATLVPMPQWVKEYRLPTAGFGLIASFFYLFLEWWMRLRGKTDLLLVERHPRVEMLPHALLYGGCVGMALAKVLSVLFLRPHATVLIKVSTEKARRNMKQRTTGVRQWHEHSEKLRRLRRFLEMVVYRHNPLIVSFPPDWRDVGNTIKRLLAR